MIIHNIFISGSLLGKIEHDQDYNMSEKQGQFRLI